MIGIWNLWIFFVLGYGTIWIAMALANRKRGKPIEDPELFRTPNSRKYMAVFWIQFIALLLVSVFTPVNFETLFLIGLPLCLLGVILNLVAMCSFAQFTGEVNTTGIYRYSRNPMYVGGFFFLLGLCLMGWSESVWSIAFLILFILSILYNHWTVLHEEAFLEQKYGEIYSRYKQNAPRYLWFL